jgi:hypothetical protein
MAKGSKYLVAQKACYKDLNKLFSHKNKLTGRLPSFTSMAR